MDPLSTPWSGYCDSSDTGFRDRGRFSKVLLFEHETWNLRKKEFQCIWPLFLPHGVEIEHIFTLKTVVSKIRADFKNCHIMNLEI